VYVTELRVRCGFDIGKNPAESLERIRNSLDSKPNKVERVANSSGKISKTSKNNTKK